MGARMGETSPRNSTHTSCGAGFDIRMKEESEVVMLQTCEVERVSRWVERRHEGG